MSPRYIQPARLLVVDDESELRGLVVRTLREAGHVVDEEGRASLDFYLRRGGVAAA